MKLKPLIGVLSALAVAGTPAIASAFDAGFLTPFVTVGGGSSPATLNQVGGFLANQLTNNRNLKNVSVSRVAVASFVNVGNLDETDRMGMQLAENMMHEMHIRGFGVVDFKTREHLKVRNNGDFVFSRDINELRRQYNIHYFLSGTVSHSADGAVINARLVEADSGLVVSTAQAFLTQRDVSRLLADDKRAKPEKVVIERPIVPSLSPNTVNLR